MSSTTTRPHISLTTIFTPAPTCSQVITSSGGLLWQGGILQRGDPDCYPESFYQIANSAYSPGVCPHGWTVDYTIWATSTGETAVFCCPSGYKYISTTVESYPGNYCHSLLTASATIYSTNDLGIGPLPQTPTLATLAALTVSPANPTYVVQDLIQVRWQSTDSIILSLFAQETALTSSASSASSTSSTSSMPSSLGPQPTSSTTTSPIPASSATGLSGGTIAAIVVSIVAIIVISGLSAWVFVLVRRRKRGNQQAREGGLPTSQQQIWLESELPRVVTAEELDASYQIPCELSSSKSPIELPGHWVRTPGLYAP